MDVLRKGSAMDGQEIGRDSAGQAQESDKETKRGRVRRLLIAPLQADGMRMPARTPAEDERAYLDRLCDELSYLTDASLEAVRVWMARHGEGSQRCFWPKMVSVLSVADAYQPRAVEDFPALVSWLSSVAGEAAWREGRLVAEFEFLMRRKRPPVSDQDRRLVHETGATWKARADRVRERIARGVEPFGDDGQWLDWYQATHARAKAIVDGGIAKRAGSGVAA